MELVPLNNIDEIQFYHGTSGAGATALLTGKDMSWFFEDVCALAKDIVSALGRHRNHLFEAADLFVDAAVDNGTSALLGLSQLVEQNYASSFSYGQLWLTTSFKMASEYALRNEQGSEAFAFLKDGLMALEFSGEADSARLLAKYPRLQDLASMDHEPVVISFRGLTCGHLQDAHGGAVSSGHVIMMASNLPGVEFTPAYRMLEVELNKIVGVYNLTNWIGQAPPEERSILALAPQAWISSHQNRPQKIAHEINRR